jgi:hypothetical protein
MQDLRCIVINSQIELVVVAVLGSIDPAHAREALRPIARKPYALRPPNKALLRCSSEFYF